MRVLQDTEYRYTQQSQDSDSIIMFSHARVVCGV